MSGWKVKAGELKIGQVTLSVCNETLTLWEDRPPLSLKGEQVPVTEQIRLPSYACAVEVANVIAKHLGKRKK